MLATLRRRERRERRQGASHGLHTDGAFGFYGPGSGHTLGLSLACPGGNAVYSPWVFAGEWGEDGFVADPDGRLWPDDEGAEPFAEEERYRRIVIQLPESPEVLLERKVITPRAR